MTKRLLFIAVIVFAIVAVWSVSVPAQFDTPNRAFHNATAFRLEGKHQTVACQACHLKGQYRGTPATCYDCHWVRRKDDRYQTQLGTECGSCHNPTSWTAVRWDHGGQTGMPLNSAHRTIACDSCHQRSTFRSASVTCVSCHQRDFDRTQSPNHRAAGFPMTCESCHRPSESTWQSSGGAGFSHSAVFPLVGTHATVACASCHKNNVYRGTPRECAGCHLANYNATRTPSHAAAGFPTTCESCHRSTDPQWGGGGTFNHNAIFALVGAHATQACASCHKNNVFRGTARDCLGCHQDDYNASRAPNHVAASFPTTCEACHRAGDPQWRGASFNHSAVFALVGVHATQACATCHRNDVYRGTPRDCVGCHIGDYNATRTPNHAAAGFPTSCESCHRATDPRWQGGSFNHNAFFALAGRHAAVGCASCHRNNVYRGTPRDCVGCHLGNYTATRNPNHAAAGFPTSCQSCHRAADSSWTQGQFTHTRFPLSGPHNVTCAQCHTTPNNFAQFSCTVCHERTRTDRDHRGQAGYRYDSAACYSCHPNGRH